MMDAKKVKKVDVVKAMRDANLAIASAYGSSFKELHDAIGIVEDLVSANTRLIDLVDNAGLDNLSHGVQLGQMSWYVKASDALNLNKQILSRIGAPA